MNDTLLIAHASSPHLTLIDAPTLQPITEIPTPGRTAVLGVSISGRYGFAVHRDDHCITLVDGTNGMARTLQSEAEPTHFHAYDGQIVIFNDGAGSISLFDENTLDQPPRMVKATQPDHGSAVVIDGYLLAGHLRLGRVDIYRIADGQLVQTFDCCPVLHGAAQVGQTAAFGCNDGVLLIRKVGETFEAIKLDNPPDAPRRTRVGIFATHPSQPLLLGNFGAGLALIDVAKAAMRILPLRAHPLKFAFDLSGETILTLTVEGILYRLDLAFGEILASVQVAQPVEVPKGPVGSPHPTFALGRKTIYVVSPDEQWLTAVDSALGIRQTLPLNDLPNAVIYLQTEAERNA